MAVTVEFDVRGQKVQAVLNRGVWSCDDAHVLRGIEASSALGARTLRSYTPHPDLTLAKFVIEDLSFFEGTIIHADPAPAPPHQLLRARMAKQREVLGSQLEQDKNQKIED